MIAKCGPALSIINDDRARERTQLAIKKGTKIVEAPEGKELPQTSTIFQWYELEEFETYGTWAI